MWGYTLASLLVLKLGVELRVQGVNPFLVTVGVQCILVLGS